MTVVPAPRGRTRDANCPDTSAPVAYQNPLGPRLMGFVMKSHRPPATTVPPTRVRSDHAALRTDPTRV